MEHESNEYTPSEETWAKAKEAVEYLAKHPVDLTYLRSIDYETLDLIKDRMGSVKLDEGETCHLEGNDAFVFLSSTLRAMCSLLRSYQSEDSEDIISLVYNACMLGYIRGVGDVSRRKISRYGVGVLAANAILEERSEDSLKKFHDELWS